MKVSDCISTMVGSAIDIVIRKISMGKDDAQSLLTGHLGPVSPCITGSGLLRELLTTLLKLMFGNKMWERKAGPLHRPSFRASHSYSKSLV